MKIGIIFNRITWEIKQLINEIEKNQINYELINNQKIYYNISKEKDLKINFDVILERSLSYLRGLYSCAILESKGYNVINNFECLNLSGNKLLTNLKLIEQNIPTPDTCIAFKMESALKAIEEIIKYPAILKPVIGSWGRLVAKLDDYTSASGNLECREEMGNFYQKIFYIQKYIAHDEELNQKSPTDLRVFVIGDKCVAAMGRFHTDKDFRSNIAIGGTAEPIEITTELNNLSLKASKAVKGEITGVDLMNDRGDLKVIEVNGTPQFKGVSNATKINVASEIIEYLLKKYK
ncbi:MAG: RimK family alpha-L-glutamate ligase [Promethearchaeota archaeon]|nr:MAG: RimK family alpha-L-glutamate ligase [Candidatus Lokiarchaeota archaeon]